MELIATKTFRGRNSRLIKKGERFTADPLLGRVYLAVGHAQHPPRETPVVAPAPAPVAAPVYQTRVMTADVEAPAPRRRGRPRKQATTTE